MKMRKNQLLLYFGKWTSHFGNIIFDYANSVFLTQVRGRSAMLLAIYQSSETIINIFFNVIGGVLADFSNRKKILIITDVISGCICFLLALLTNTIYVDYIIIIANILLALVYSFNSPTYKAIIKEMILKDDIGVYNSISSAGVEILGIIGPLLALIIVNKIGAEGAMLFDAGTFWASAIAECFLKKVNIDVDIDNFRSKNDFFKMLVEGFQYLYNEKKIFTLIIISAIVNFFLAGYNLLLPYVNSMYKYNEFYSKALTAEAIGGILGSALNSVILKKTKKKRIEIMPFLTLTGLSLVIVPFASRYSVMFICGLPFILFGTFLTIYNINFMTIIQTNVSEQYLGRVFSIIFTIAVAFMPVGSFTFSRLKNITDVNNFLSIGVGIVIVSILGGLAIRKSSK